MKRKKIYVVLVLVSLFAMGCTWNNSNQPRVSQPAPANNNTTENAVSIPGTTNTISDDEKQKLLQEIQDIKNQANEINDASTSTQELDPNIQLNE